MIFPDSITVTRPQPYTGPTDDAGQPTAPRTTETVYEGAADVQKLDRTLARSMQRYQDKIDYMAVLPDYMATEMSRFETDDEVEIEGDDTYRVVEVATMSPKLGLEPI